MNFEDQINELIKGSFQPIIVDDFRNFNLSEISDGILMVYATWSGEAKTNLYAAIEFLKRIDYDKPLIITDTNCFSSEQYICH